MAAIIKNIPKLPFTIVGNRGKQFPLYEAKGAIVDVQQTQAGCILVREEPEDQYRILTEEGELIDLLCDL